MNMADVIAFDPRPTYFGDRMIVTGTLTADGTAADIDLSSLLASVDNLLINGQGGTARAAPTSSVDGTTVKLGSLVDTAVYQFTAIGRRS